MIWTRSIFQFPLCCTWRRVSCKSIEPVKMATSPHLVGILPSLPNTNLDNLESLIRSYKLHKLVIFSQLFRACTNLPRYICTYNYKYNIQCLHMEEGFPCYICTYTFQRINSSNLATQALNFTKVNNFYTVNAIIEYVPINPII